MAQTNQIFAPQVYAQAPKINPAIFAQAVPAFKALDLTTILEAEKMEYLKQKMAIDAQKNMIDLEEAKARLKIAENAIIEKRKAESRASLKMLADQMDLKGGEQTEEWRSDESRRLFAERNNEYNNLVASAPNLPPDEMAAKGAAWQMKWATNDKHFTLMQQDEYMKGLIKESQKNNSPINDRLLNDLKEKHRKNQIDITKIDTNSLLVDGNYMKKVNEGISKELGKMYTEREETPTMVDGKWIRKVTKRHEPNYDQVLAQAYSTISQDPNYQLYLTNQARANQLYNNGMPTQQVTDIDAEVNKLAMQQAEAIAARIPDLDATQLDRLTRTKISYSQKSQPAVVVGGSNNLYRSEINKGVQLGLSGKFGDLSDTEQLKIIQDKDVNKFLMGQGIDESNNPKLTEKVAASLIAAAKNNILDIEPYTGEAEGYGLYIKGGGKTKLFLTDENEARIAELEKVYNGTFASNDEKLKALQRVDKGYNAIIYTKDTKTGNYGRYQVKDTVWEAVAEKLGDKVTDNTIMKTILKDIQNNTYEKGIDYFVPAFTNVKKRPQQGGTKATTGTKKQGKLDGKY